MEASVKKGSKSDIGWGIFNLSLWLFALILIAGVTAYFLDWYVTAIPRKSVLHGLAWVYFWPCAFGACVTAIHIAYMVLQYRRAPASAVLPLRP